MDDWAQVHNIEPKTLNFPDQMTADPDLAKQVIAAGNRFQHRDIAGWLADVHDIPASEEAVRKWLKNQA